NGAKLGWNSPSHPLQPKADGADLLLDAAQKDAKIDRDVVLSVTDTDADAAEQPRFSSFEQDGAKYLMLRYRPALATRERPRPEGRTWVFLFESSGDRDPLLARTQIEVIRALLGNAEPDDTFAVLAAGTRVRSLSNAPLSVTPENVQSAISFLENAHLI